MYNAVSNKIDAATTFFHTEDALVEHLMECGEVLEDWDCQFKGQITEHMCGYTYRYGSEFSECEHLVNWTDERCEEHQ